MRLDKRKCDRCDQEYHTERNVKVNKTIVPAVYVMDRDTFFGQNVRLVGMDLCDKCLDSLQEWWDVPPRETK